MRYTDGISPGRHRAEHEITKEVYDLLMATTPRYHTNTFMRACGAEWMRAYDASVYDVYERDGRYYVTLDMSNSCD